MRESRVLACTLAAFAVMACACHDSDTASAADPPKIELKASVAPLEGTVVTASVDGEIAQVQTSEGATVHAGDPLFTLTNPAVERDIAYAHAAVIAAESRLRQSHAAPRRVQQSDEGERTAAAIVQSKQQKVDRLRALLASGDIAKQELQDAETELAVAKRDLAAERDRRTNAVAAPSADPAVLQAEAERARADLSFAEHRKAQMTIKAPASGTIAQLRVRAGDQVYPRDPLAQIVDSSTVRVQAQLAPELLRFVHAGATVDVKLMTIPPRRFREPIARVTPPGAEGGPSVTVNVPNPDRMLQPGTPALVTIR